MPHRDLSPGAREALTEIDRQAHRLRVVVTAMVALLLIMLAGALGLLVSLSHSNAEAVDRLRVESAARADQLEDTQAARARFFDRLDQLEAQNARQLEQTDACTPD